MKDITVPPERLDRWLRGFAERHGQASCVATPELVTVMGADGARAECRVPFPPLIVDDARQYGGLLEHVTRDRLVGVVLVRRGGYAAGVFQGRVLVASKVGTRHVQGRSAAGGWSQQRFARRREKQAQEAFGAAADVVARVVLPYGARLDAVVLGGDKAAASAVIDDTRLRPLRPLVVAEHLPVPDPRLAVLKSTPDRFRAVAIRVVEPAGCEGSAQA